MADLAPPKRQPAIGRRLFVLASTVVWLTVLAFVFKNSIDRLSVPPWGNPVGDTLSAEIAGTTHVGQQFVAPLPGLKRIKVSLDPATARGTHRVTFHLKTAPSATDLWTSDLSTSDVQEGIPYTFEFPRIVGSKGQTYYFHLESTDSAPGDAIAAHYSPTAIVNGATAYLN
ncbi:hypothetical protein ACFLYD_06950, partial [Chloroflexota bacterium]